MLGYLKQCERMAGFTEFFGFNPMAVDQNSYEWFVLRSGRVTASMAKQFLMATTTKGFKNYIDSVFCQLACGVQPQDNNFKQTDWGKQQEINAAQWYEFTSSEPVGKIPFIMSDDSFFGCSPDRMLMNGKGVELKCPWDSQVYYSFFMNDELKDEWFLQCQFSMWVSGSEAWDLCMYDPRMEKLPCGHIKTYEPDEIVFKKLDDRKEVYLEMREKVVRTLEGFA